MENYLNFFEGKADSSFLMEKYRQMIYFFFTYSKVGILEGVIVIIIIIIIIAGRIVL